MEQQKAAEYLDDVYYSATALLTNHDEAIKRSLTRKTKEEQHIAPSHTESASCDMADIVESVSSGSAEAGPSKTPLVTFKKAKSRPSSLTKRKRSTSPSSAGNGADVASEPVSSSVIRAKHAAAPNPLVQGTKRLREEKEKARLQDRARELAALEYRADESVLGDVGERTLATRSADWDLDKDEGKRSGETIKRARMDEDGNLLPDDGLYHGTGGYTNFIKPDPNLNRSSKTRAGPIKATSNIRTITVVDYQPDVCKDYKETGFCGYGDSCKFLHDRGDYLAGWQLDKLAVNPATGSPEPEESEDEDVPFACLICRKPFKDPVVTKCGHYFDMDCAVKRYAKGQTKCYACGASTGGMFNKAEKILAKMNAKNAARAEARSKDIFGNKKEPGSDEDEDGGIEFGGDEDEGDDD